MKPSASSSPSVSGAETPGLAGSRGVSRRAVSTAAAWTVPAVAIAAGAPLAAASPTVGRVIITAADGNTVTGPGRAFADLTVRLYAPDGVTSVPSNTAQITVQLPAGYTWGDGGTQSTRTFTATGGQFVLTGANAIVASSGTASTATLSATATDPSPAAGAPSSFTAGTLGLSAVVTAPGTSFSGVRVWGRDNTSSTVYSTAFTTGLDVSSSGTVPRAALMNEAPGAILDHSGMGNGDGYVVTALNQLVANTQGGGLFDAPYGSADNVFAAPVGLLAGEKIIRVKSDNGSGIVLTDFGRILTWATNAQTGQLGDGTNTVERQQPTPITTFPEGTFITQIASAQGRYYALDKQGQVWTWGYGGVFGDGAALGNGDAVGGDTSRPNRVVTSADGSTVLTGATEVSSMAAGGAALVGGRVFTWGSGAGNPLANGTSYTSRNFAAPARTATGELTGIVKLGKTGMETNFTGGAPGLDSAGVVTAIDGAGNLWSWGRTTQLASGGTSNGAVYAAIDAKWQSTGLGPVADVYTAFDSITIILANDSGSGNIWSWGNSGDAQYGNGSGTIGGGINPTPTQPVNAGTLTPTTGHAFNSGNVSGRVLMY